MLFHLISLKFQFHNSSYETGLIRTIQTRKTKFRVFNVLF